MVNIRTKVCQVQWFESMIRKVNMSEIGIENTYCYDQRLIVITVNHTGLLFDHEIPEKELLDP